MSFDYIAVLFGGMILLFTYQASSVADEFNDTNENTSSVHTILKAPDSNRIRSDWVRRACSFSSDIVWRNTHGNFPELDKIFLKKMQQYEERLCIRQVNYSLSIQYQAQQLNIDLENKIMALAHKCKYLGRNIFPYFVYNYLVLGPSLMEKSINYKCNSNRTSDDIRFYMRLMTAKNVNYFLFLIDVLEHRGAAEEYLNRHSQVR